VRRDLFVTVDMLRRSGLQAELTFAEGSIRVRLNEHRAVFAASQSARAADWLAACTIMNYPESELSKLWLTLARAAGGVIPFGSR
jgi:hypothetical protein